MLAALPLSAQDAPTGSLWRQETSNSMFSDKKARSVGDILTIVVQESATASRQNDTKTGRSSSVDASISSFLFSPTASGALTKKGTLPAMKFSGKNDFEGSGQINNSETITTRIPVRVYLDLDPGFTQLWHVQGAGVGLDQRLVLGPAARRASAFLGRSVARSQPALGRGRTAHAH
ncbi:MAG: flagellar basal body L-ring protein FlgH [Verrucomicrobia bacterium]|nr:flagellar basal body L-ring protein FlgH [Verrucomicrobiota bacterium]